MTCIRFGGRTRVTTKTAADLAVVQAGGKPPLPPLESSTTAAFAYHAIGYLARSAAKADEELANQWHGRRFSRAEITTHLRRAFAASVRCPTALPQVRRAPFLVAGRAIFRVMGPRGRYAVPRRAGPGGVQSVLRRGARCIYTAAA